MIKWALKSKTIWANLVAILATWVMQTFGFELSAQDQIMILGVLNIILRAITKDAITWKYR